MVIKSKVKKIAHDATPTWSGFNYQAKVALYIVLDMINVINDRDELNQYSLELEWIEDIAIVKGEQYLSVHQVKAMQEYHLSAYKDAIWGVLHRIKSTSASFGYLHTIVQIENINSEKIKKAKPSNEDVYLDLMNSGFFDSIIQRFSLYQYSNQQSFIYLSDIDNIIQNQLKVYYSNKSQLFIERAYLTLLNLINKHVVDRHIDIHKSKISKDDPNRKPERIPFNKIINILEQDYEQQSSDHLIYRLKDLFNKYCEEYISSYGEDDLMFLHKAMVYINHLPKLQFIEFCRKVNPHIIIEKDFTDQEFHRLFQETNTKEAFFSILHIIKKEFSLGRISYYKNEQFYFPTTIVLNSQHPHYEKNKRILAENILENKGTIPLLFEEHCMISGGGEFPSLSLFEERINYDKFTDQEKNHIMKILPIRMIDINTATTELNDNEDDC